MPIGDICVREVAVADRNTTIQDAAMLMRGMHVGDLIVVQNTNGHRVPVGIITDRDIVVSVVATKLDAAVFTIGDLVSHELVSCREDEGIFECIQQMRVKGVRRMPVLSRDGGLLGIVAVDDLLQLLGEELNELGKLVGRERAREAQTKQGLRV